MGFDQFLQKQRTLGETLRTPFWTPLYTRLLEILEAANQDDIYPTIQALYTEHYQAIDPLVKSFWQRKEDELRDAIR